MSQIVLLLKTESTPTDAYRILFSQHGRSPLFIPVLAHKPNREGLETLQQLLVQRSFASACPYSGLIFTSQRAAEAFASLVHQYRPPNDEAWPHLQNIPVYSVGPATTRCLEAVPQQPPLQIFGTNTGNGETLAHFILDHYNGWTRPCKPRALLFVVGQQHRDVIPRSLQNPSLSAERRIQVDQVIVYQSTTVDSFQTDLVEALNQTESILTRWIVVFSPAGCGDMLRALGLLDNSTGKVPAGRRSRTILIATIGPTTRAHLVNEYDYEPDVCADTPTPEGLLQGILQVEASR
ncbi:hypothetical protein CDD82_2066 [Ophiocordyceps australis]|uniref:Tetrapyrrole biosynthesis uroporphyrinogen III synthase domain-containing protein n=1 Tax=Ophiocordyceps australis TaxID=1399860 RepID=A0A2C5X8X6_9HYPO|nr:hypothetical protein CDD82_2066 [Ophiocordyceps australis]